MSLSYPLTSPGALQYGIIDGGANCVYIHFMFMHVLMSDEKEGRKKQASRVKQTTRQSNTAHSKQSLFLKKNELPRVGLVRSRQRMLYTCI